jgi:hypothetical protein
VKLNRGLNLKGPRACREGVTVRGLCCAEEEEDTCSSEPIIY